MSLISRFYILTMCYMWLHTSRGIKIDTLKYCCGLGTNYATSGLKCTSFQTPIAGVQKEDESSCLNSIDVCCKNQYRMIRCDLGKNDAKAGNKCESSLDESGSDFRKECCNACEMGRETGNAGQACTDGLGLGRPYDTAFSECCNEVSSSSSPIKILTSTTALQTTSIKPDVTQLQSKNGTSTSDPPLENPCDISDICAHICIPTNDSYKCDCYKGFALMADGISCKPNKHLSPQVNRCDINNPCEQKCLDTGVAIKCACNDGFELAKDKRSCNDIDECALNLHECAKNEVCVNGDGFYYCEDPNNPDADSEDGLDKCPEGYHFNGEKLVCDDIDECVIDIVCPRPKLCINTIGSFTCEGEDVTQCPPGFHFKAATATCEDIDECVTGQDDCNRESQTCLNTKGNFTCIDKVSKKNCPPGFKKNLYTQNCDDINECEETEGLCAENEECVNEPGGHTCILKLHKNSTSAIPLNNFPLPSPTQPTSISSTYVSSWFHPSTTPVTSAFRQRPTEHPLTSTTAKSSLPTVFSDSNRHYTPPQRNELNAFSSTTRTPQQQFPFQSNPNVQSSFGSREPFSNSRYPSQNTNSYPTWVSPISSKPVQNQSNSQPVLCPVGFEYSETLSRCQDINECQNDHNTCNNNNQDCHNTPGSYVCSCKVGFSKDYNTGSCVDINECQTGTHGCTDGLRCDNTIGSYICARITGCGTGYTLNLASGLCEDDDECQLGTHNCKDLGNQFQCRNTLGSYRCERVRCTDCFVSRIFTTSSTRYTPSVVQPTHSYPIISGQLKNCLPGYTRNSYGQCEDINECENNPCGKGEKCKNLNGKYHCIKLIQCSRGYEINEAGDSCVDVNECARGIHKCTSKQVCKNGPGYYTCQCPPGHQINLHSTDCEDIDECRLTYGRVCSVNAECKNTVGSYQCVCKEGYVTKGDTCEDVDECSQNGKLCEQSCVNTWGSFRCSCKQGFILNPDNRTCTDIDECEKFKDSKLCIGTCQNTPGSYACTCPPGYKLGSDERVCQDIDECTQHVCQADDICLNTRGGYKCHTIKCPQNYVRDPDHRSRCKRASNICDPRDSQCLLMPEQYSFHFITLVSNLQIAQGRIPFFQMKGPDWKIASADFNMELVNVNCPNSVQRADESNFHVHKFYNALQLYLVKSIEGPQEIELKVEMKLYVRGVLNGVLVAKIFIIVSEYPF